MKKEMYSNLQFREAESVYTNDHTNICFKMDKYLNVWIYEQLLPNINSSAYL